MDTYEFRTKVDKVLESIENEEQELKSNLEFYEQVDAASYNREIGEANKRLKELDEKRNKLANYLEFALYARIMSMSDVEVEEFRKEKIEDLEREYRKIDLKTQERSNEKRDLEKKEKELMEKFKTADSREKQRIIHEAQEVKTQLSRYSDIPNDTKERENIVQEIENFKKESVDDIKRKM